MMHKRIKLVLSIGKSVCNAVCIGVKLRWGKLGIEVSLCNYKKTYVVICEISNILG